MTAMNLLGQLHAIKLEVITVLHESAYTVVRATRQVNWKWQF